VIYIFSIFRVDLRVEVDMQFNRCEIPISQYVVNAPNGYEASCSAHRSTASDDFGGRVVSVVIDGVEKLESLPVNSCVAIYESSAKQIPLITAESKAVYVQ
jgi:hypothetical protein